MTTTVTGPGQAKRGFYDDGHNNDRPLLCSDTNIDIYLSFQI